MSEISFIFVDKEILILKHFCRYGQKSSQIFLIFIIEVDIISIFSIKGKTNVSNWRVRPVHRRRESRLWRSRKAPAKTSVNKQPDKQSPWNAPKKLWNSADKDPLTLTLSLVLDSKSLTERFSEKLKISSKSSTIFYTLF